MRFFYVSIQVIKTYVVKVEAASETGAIGIVQGMSSEKIAQEGQLQDVTTDYAQIEPE